MPITIREARSSRADRDWIEETYGEYLADLTADTTGVYPSLTVTGQSVSEIIQGWFHDDRCTAFLVLREQEPVGFAVVQRSLSSSEDPKRNYRLTEFFISKPFRSKGVGRGAAMLIFARYAGEWTVAEQSTQSWRDPVLATRRRRIHERQIPREARPGRDRPPVHERGAGTRHRALSRAPIDDYYFLTATWMVRGPATSNKSSRSNFCPSTSGFLSPISITCMPFGSNSRAWSGIHVQHRDLAHARHAVLDLGAVNLHLRRDRRGNLQQPVRLAGVVLQA